MCTPVKRKVCSLHLEKACAESNEDPAQSKKQINLKKRKILSYANKYPSDRDCKTPFPPASTEIYFDKEYSYIPDSKGKATELRKTKSLLGKECLRQPRVEFQYHLLSQQIKRKKFQLQKLWETPGLPRVFQSPPNKMLGFCIYPFLS